MTQTEICNRALALLGHDRTITDYSSDASAEGVRCRQFYPSALSDVLAEHDWDFAAVERSIGTVHADEFGWARFPIPSDALRIIEVTDAEGHPFKTKRNRDFLNVKTDGNPAKMRYISTDISPEEFPHKFAEAVVAQLAYLLCGPMYGDDGKTNNFFNLARQKMSDAVTKDADETAYRGNWENPFIKARG